MGCRGHCGASHLLLQGAAIRLLECPALADGKPLGHEHSFCIDVEGIDTLFDALKPGLSDLPTGRVRAPFDQPYRQGRRKITALELLRSLNRYMALTDSRAAIILEDEVRIVYESAEEPDEWLFELVVRFGGDVVVLEVLLPVEGNLLGLDFSILDVDLISY